MSAGPIQQPYETLGNVDFAPFGFDRTDGGAIRAGGFAVAWARRTFSKATPAEMYALLRKQALYQYGTRVDAIINVNYQSDPANNVFATALAVRFKGQPTAGGDGADLGSEAERLRKLNELLDTGLITRTEFEERRKLILDGIAK